MAFLARSREKPVPKRKRGMERQRNPEKPGFCDSSQKAARNKNILSIKISRAGEFGFLKN